MASQIIVDQLKKTGGVLTALTLPSVNATTGQYMQNDGSGGLSWVAAPQVGLTTASQWRLTADFANSVAPLTTNLVEIATPLGFGKLPDEAAAGANSMAKDVTGHFTFPSTGCWLITFNGDFEVVSGNENNAQVQIETTTNNSTYVAAAQAGQCIFDYTGTNTLYGNAVASYLFRVADVTTHKARFNISVANASTTTLGNANINETCITFSKLGD